MNGIGRAVGVLKRGCLGPLCTLCLLVAACGGPTLEGQWTGRGPDGRPVGYVFDGDGTGSEARGDTVREFTYKLDARYDPPRLELSGQGWREQGVVRLIGEYQMRVLLTASAGRTPQSFTPEAPGVILLRRELR